MRTLASLAAVLACSCGRVGFATVDDATTTGSGDAGGDPDALPAGPCTPITTIVPGYTPRSYKINRIPNGWAIVGGQDGATTDIRLVVIDDANTISPPVTLIAGVGVYGVEWINDALVVVYSTTGSPGAARFALDGTMLGTPVVMTATNAFQNSRAGTAIEIGLVGPTAGTASIATLDATSTLALGPAHQVTTNAFGIDAISRDTIGDVVAWESGTIGNFQLHLSGLDASGTLRLVDRQYGMGGAGASLIWTGTHHLFTWSASGSMPPNLLLLDENLAELTPVTAFLGLSSGQSYLAWNGRELAAARLDFVPNAREVAFVVATENGGRLTADADYGTGTFGGASNPFVAGGPSRFAFTWGSGPTTRLNFVVVCR